MGEYVDLPNLERVIAVNQIIHSAHDIREVVASVEVWSSRIVIHSTVTAPAHESFPHSRTIEEFEDRLRRNSLGMRDDQGNTYEWSGGGGSWSGGVGSSSEAHTLQLVDYRQVYAGPLDPGAKALYYRSVISADADEFELRINPGA